MKVYKSIDDFLPLKRAVVTIGTFDGVHLGHQKILYRLRKAAEEIDAETVVLTFFPHPRMILHPNDDLKLLNTLDEKIKLFDKFNIDHLIIHPFSTKFSEMTSSEFIKEILVNKIGVKTLIIGYDHHFGKNREGSFEQLKLSAPIYKFDIEEISKQDIENIAISSTKIRNAILKGEVEIANSFLGYPYFITGKVVEGKKLGRQLGYPTANLEILEKYKLIPQNGIYAVKVHLNKKTYFGMMSIGMNPTVQGEKKTIEVNIFEFEMDIYGQEVRVDFISKMRDEVKFDNIDQLKFQLGLDKTNAINILHSS